MIPQLFPQNVSVKPAHISVIPPCPDDSFGLFVDEFLLKLIAADTAENDIIGSSEIFAALIPDQILLSTNFPVNTAAPMDPLVASPDKFGETVTIEVESSFPIKAICVTFEPAKTDFVDAVSLPAVEPPLQIPDTAPPEQRSHSTKTVEKR